MIFQHKDILEARKYYWLKEERNQFQGVQNENFVEAFLVVNKLKDYANRPCFSIAMPNYKQSNTDGMFMLVGSLHELRSKVVFTIDDEGKLDKVWNLQEIENKWLEVKNKLDKNFLKRNPHAEGILNQVEELITDRQRFSAALRYAAPYINLFPGIHRTNEAQDAEAVIGYRELPNFLAAPKVPVITNEKIVNRENNTIEIQATGSIDKENFEQDKLTAMIRILKNRPRVPAQLQLKYEERILLDDMHWPLQNVCMSLAYVPGTLYREEKSIIKSL